MPRAFCRTSAPHSNLLQSAGCAWVAQLVEHSPEEGRVAGSIPAPSTMDSEHFVGKVSLRALIEREEKVLLCKGAGDSVWQLPGGRLHKNEDPYVGLAREILEELGVAIENPKLFHTQHFIHFKTKIPQVMLVFSCSLSESEEPKATDPNDLEEVRWVSPSELKGLAFFDDCDAALKVHFGRP